MTELTTTHLRGQLLNAIANYEAAKRRFAAVTEAYKPGRDPYTAEIMAAGDHRRQAAAADCGFYGAEIERYGTALIALTLTGGDL